MMSRIVTLVLALAAVVGLAVPSVAGTRAGLSARNADPGLLAPAEPDRMTSVSETILLSARSDRTVRRATVARINDSAVGRICATSNGSASAVPIRLFDDVAFQVSGRRLRESDSGRRVEWEAEVDGQPLSRVLLTFGTGCVYEAGEAIMAGSVRLQDGRTFVLISAGPGLTVITEHGGTDGPLGEDHLPLPPRPGKAPVIAPPPAGLETGPQVIDILGLYTPKAREDYGGKRGEQTHLALEVGEANLALQNSGVQTRIRLVGTEEVNYQGNELMSAIYALQAAGDSVMDEAHILRDRYGADLVTLDMGRDVVGTSVGLGFRPVPPTNVTDHLGFSAFGGAPSMLVLAHEIGHNIGLDHDWRTERGRPYSIEYAFNHGSIGPDDRWHTIMAYGSACGFCRVIPYFSNPDLSFEGGALGVRDGAEPTDNARMLRVGSPPVAAYRPTVVPVEVYALRVLATAGGTAIAAYPGPYYAGTYVPVTAVPQPGFVFSGWFLDGEPYGTDLATRVEVNQARSILARFTRVTSDLRLSVSTPKIKNGKPFTYKVSVTNNGPFKASGVITTGAVPKTVKKLSVQGRACSRSAARYRCSLGDVPSNQTSSVTIRGALPRKSRGQLILTAAVAAQTPDPVANNTVTRKLKIK